MHNEKKALTIEDIDAILGGRENAVKIMRSLLELEEAGAFDHLTFDNIVEAGCKK